MRGLRIWLLLAAVLLLVTAWTGSPSVAAAAPSDRATVAELINAQRAQRGLPALVVNSSLTTAAQRYADTMADGNFFSHTGWDGSTMVGRVQATGYTDWSFLAENLAAGYRTPEQAVAAWMNSAGHRANILSTRTREIGVGQGFSASSTYKIYWVADLGA